MATRPDSDDLDRTDELPQLDVVAYEARRGLNDGLSTTDTWLVEGLEEQSTETIVRTGQAGFPVPGGVDLTINVSRLRQRIQALESELESARSVARESEAAGRIPNAERNEINARIAAIEAQNEHLREQQQIAEALTQRLQQQLREQADVHKSQVAKADASREADRLAAEQQRVLLEQQLENSTARFSGTADEQARLNQAMEEARELAASRARQVDELHRALNSEQTKAHTLGRNLAAKLADYDIVSSLVTQRNATIASLERSREELDGQLQQSFADARRLAELLDDANKRAATSDSQSKVIAERDERLAQLALELEAVRHQERQSQAVREALEQNLQEASAQAATGQQQRDELLARIDQLTAERTQFQATQQSLDSSLREASAASAQSQQREAALSSRVDELQSAAQALMQERDSLLATRQELQDRVDELSQVSASLDEAKRDAASVWSELEKQSALARSRQDELDTVLESVEELRRINADLRQRTERLQGVSEDDTRLLNERNAELARSSVAVLELRSTLQGLETSLRARDTLIENLRTEIRTSQEERGIMSEQLTKARSRVKTLTQQLFNRDNRIATLKTDLAVHIEALAAIRQDVDHATEDAAPVLPVERLLEPVGHAGASILLNRRVMTIGRTDDNDIAIPSKMISRHHARLLVGPNAVIVEDAGSTNGCYVNEQQVKQHVLHEGDVLAMGDLRFKLVVRPALDGTRQEAG